MSTHTSTDDLLAPELEAIAVAAAARLHGDVTETAHDEQVHRAVAQAASAAMSCDRTCCDRSRGRRGASERPDSSMSRP
jgi:hypothetical protein